MPEERHQPSQSSPHQRMFAQEIQKMSPPQQQREVSHSVPPARTLPQSFLPHLPFWEQPSFQKDIPPTQKLSSSPLQQRRETFSSSPSAQKQALSFRSPQQKMPTSFSKPQQSPFNAPSQKLQYSQASFPQPKKLHPLPSSKYIHPSPFDEIYQKYSLPKPVVIGKEGKFLYRQDPSISQNFRETANQDKNLSSEDELERIHQQEQEIERKWGATSDPNEKARLEAQVATLWKRSKEIQFGAGWQPGGPVQPPRGGQVLKAVTNILPGWVGLAPGREDAFKDIEEYLLLVGVHYKLVKHLLRIIRRLIVLMEEKYQLWHDVKWYRRRQVTIRNTLYTYRRLIADATDTETTNEVRKDLEILLTEETEVYSTLLELEQALFENRTIHREQNNIRIRQINRLRILIIATQTLTEEQINEIMKNINRFITKEGLPGIILPPELTDDEGQEKME